MRIQAEIVKEERRKQKLKKDSLKVDVEVLSNNDVSSIHFFVLGEKNFRGRNQGKNTKEEVTRVSFGPSVMIVRPGALMVVYDFFLL